MDKTDQYRHSKWLSMMKKRQSWFPVSFRLARQKGQPKSTTMWLRAACLLLLFVVDLPVFAGTISGQIQTATGGAINNGTLTFTLSQPAVLAHFRVASLARVRLGTSS